MIIFVSHCTTMESPMLTPPLDQDSLEFLELSYRAEVKKVLSGVNGSIGGCEKKDLWRIGPDNQ